MNSKREKAPKPVASSSTSHLAPPRQKAAPAQSESSESSKAPRASARVAQRISQPTKRKADAAQVEGEGTSRKRPRISEITPSPLLPQQAVLPRRRLVVKGSANFRPAWLEMQMLRDRLPALAKVMDDCTEI